jgi:long-chain acyl-CoA synthetase
VLYGASPIPSELLARFIREFKSWQFFQGYGMTESTALAVSLPWEEHHLDGPLANRRTSAGRPVLGVEVRIAEDDGTEAPAGDVGEILIRGDLVMTGYWRRPELTRQTIRDGWLHSGDLGYRDDDGFVHIVDRKKDMIITGGENVYSTEVESAIYAHPSVAECAVIGLRSDRWGELVHAVVVPKEGAVLSASDVIEHCRAHVGGYKCPKSITIRRDGLPKSGAGKVLKTVLREQLASQSEPASAS